MKKHLLCADTIGSGSGSSGSGVSQNNSASGNGSVSGSGIGASSRSALSLGSGYDNTSDSGSGSSNGSASSGEGRTDEQFTVGAFLQVTAQDGGIQCHDAGQFECVARNRISNRYQKDKHQYCD